MNRSLYRHLLILCCGLVAVAPSATVARPNVLLICVDDLRTELGCYGQAHMKTPHIDRLAESGRLFSHHYVHQAACGPSRSTLLSGIRTDSWNYLGKRKLQAPPASLPELFRTAGYQTVSIGKVAHSPGANVPRGFHKAYAPTGPWKTPQRAFFGYAHGKAHHKMVWPKDKSDYLPWEGADVDDTGYPDGLNAAAAVSELRQFSNDDKPFFLAVGFYKPHLPFNAPKRYWDLYEREKLPLAAWRQKPLGVDPGWTFHHGTMSNYEPTTHYKWKWGDYTVPAEQGRILRHAYSACVSYTDAQIGRVLQALKELKLDDNTIVVLWSDHGWHLGEHGIWGKFTLHDVSVRSPLIVRVPEMSKPGVASESLVETVDILPTLCDLAGVEIGERFQGKSFAASVRDPAAPARDSALSDLPVDNGNRGWSIRTMRYRYTRWFDRDGVVVLEELYDHDGDPGETRNLVRSRPLDLGRTRKIMDRRLAELDLAQVYRK